MKKTDLTPVAEALDIILQDAAVCPDSVILPLESALSHILAESVIAAIDVPSHDNSAMDGFALNTKTIPQAGTILPVSQTIAAGQRPAPLSPGTAARIFTGAVVPEGADAVVLQEDAEFDQTQVKVLALPQQGQHIRPRGHDIGAGSEVLAQGRRLQAQDIGLLASLGMAEVGVFRTLRIAILATGDELTAPGSVLQEGRIYESNSYTLAALISALGMEPVRVGIVPDDAGATRSALSEAAAGADCIISSGGVSVGAADHVRQAVAELGELSLWKLALKPGKPFSFGSVAGKPFFGLPGNPVAVFVTFLLLVKPYLLKMQGCSDVRPTVFRLPAGFVLPANASRQEYVRVRVRTTAQGIRELEAFPDQGSSVMTSVSWAHGLAVIPPRMQVKKGDLLEYLPFSGLFSGLLSGLL